MIYEKWGVSSYSKNYGDGYTPPYDPAYTPYVAFFRTIPDKHGRSEKVKVAFYSNHPVHAIRAIIDAANRGKHPSEFQHQIIEKVLSVRSRGKGGKVANPPVEGEGAVTAAP